MPYIKGEERDAALFFIIDKFKKDIFERVEGEKLNIIISAV